MGLWSPAFLANQKVWVVADDPKHVVSSGILNQAAEKSGAVTGGFMNYLDAGRMQYGVTTQNGRPLLSNSGASNRGILGARGLDGTWSSLSKSATVVHMFILHRMTTNGSLGYDDILGAINVGSGMFGRTYLQRNYTATGDIMAGGRRLDSDSFTAGSTGANHGMGFVLAHAEFNPAASALTIRVNGVTVFSGTWLFGTNFDSTDSYDVNMGGQITSARAEYAEFLYMRGSMTPDERQRTEAYMLWAWGLQSLLAADHPYKSAAPLDGTTYTGRPLVMASSREVVEMPNEAISAVRTAIGAEPAITPGTTSQYLKGDKSWADFTTSTYAAKIPSWGVPSTVAPAAGDVLSLMLSKIYGAALLRVAKAGDEMTGFFGFATPYSVTAAATTSIVSTSNLVTVNQTTNVTTQITSLGNGKAGQVAYVRFNITAGTVALLNGSNLICPGAQNISVSNGDFMIVRCDASNVWRIAQYTPNITPLKYVPVNKAGDTMTGDLSVAKAGPAVVLNKTASGQVSQIQGLTAGKARWSNHLGSSEPESGGGGSDWRLFRHDDAGNPLGEVAAFTRASGSGYLYYQLNLKAGAVASPIPFGGSGEAPFISNVAMSGAAAAFEGWDSGSRRWRMELGQAGTADFILGRWSGNSFTNAPITISWGSAAIGLNGVVTTSSSLNVGGTIYSNGRISNNSDAYVPYGYIYDGSASTAVKSVDGAYQQSGNYRTNMLWNLQPGMGDVNYGSAYHYPGVESFFQINVGGAGKFFRFNNSGWGTSNAGWTTHSDIRTKKEIRRLDRVRERVEGLPAFIFKKKNDPENRDYIGTISQVAEKQNPELVRETSQMPWDKPDGVDADGNPKTKRMRVIDTIKSADYGQAAMIANAGAIDLYGITDRLLARIEELESRISALEALQSSNANLPPAHDS